jgi:hypothetical protein
VADQEAAEEGGDITDAEFAQLKPFKDAADTEKDPQLRAIKRARFWVELGPIVRAKAAATGDNGLVQSWMAKGAQLKAEVESARPGFLGRAAASLREAPLETTVLAGQDAAGAVNSALSPMQVDHTKDGFLSQAGKGVYNMATGPLRVGAGMLQMPAALGAGVGQAANAMVGRQPVTPEIEENILGIPHALASMAATAINPIAGAAAWSVPQAAQAAGTASVEGPHALGDAVLTNPEAFGIGLPAVAKAHEVGARLFKGSAEPMTAPAAAGPVVTEQSMGLAAAIRELAKRFPDVQDPKYQALKAQMKANPGAAQQILAEAGGGAGDQSTARPWVPRRDPSQKFNDVTGEQLDAEAPDSLKDLEGRFVRATLALENERPGPALAALTRHRDALRQELIQRHQEAQAAAQAPTPENYDRWLDRQPAAFPPVPYQEPQTLPVPTRQVYDAQFEPEPDRPQRLPEETVLEPPQLPESQFSSRSNIIDMPPPELLKRGPGALADFNRRQGVKPKQAAREAQSQRDQDFRRTSVDTADLQFEPGDTRNRFPSRPTEALNVPPPDVVDAAARADADETAKFRAVPAVDPDEAVRTELVDQYRKVPRSDLQALRARVAASARKLFGKGKDKGKQLQLQAIDQVLGEQPPEQPTLFDRAKRFAADDRGEFDLGRTVQAGAEGVAGAIRGVKRLFGRSPGPEVDPEELDASPEAARASAGLPPPKYPETARLALEQARKMRGAPDINLDQFDDADVQRQLQLELDDYTDRHGIENPLAKDYHVNPSERLKGWVGPVDATLLRPHQPSHPHQGLSESLAQLESGSEDMGHRVERFVMGDKARSMDAADHEAVARVADGSGTPEDQQRVESRGLGDVVERLHHLANLAMMDPTFHQKGLIVDRPYFTRAGLKGWVSDTVRASEAQSRGVGKSRALEIERSREDVPPEFWRGVDVGKQASFYGKQLFNQKYADPFYKDFLAQNVNGPPDESGKVEKGTAEFPAPGSYAAEAGRSFDLAHQLVKNSIGTPAFLEDSLFAAPLKTAVNSEVAKRLGMTTEDAVKGTGAFAKEGPVQWARGGKLQKGAQAVVRYLGETQRPVTDFFQKITPIAAAAEVGLNTASAVRHAFGDGWALLGQAAQHPVHFARSVYERIPGLRDPAFGEKMQEAGLWKRPDRLAESYRSFANADLAGKSSKAIDALKLLTRHIEFTDEVFKGLAVKMGEKEALARGLDPDAAFRAGVELARTTQNNSKASNTNPLMAGPVARGVMMFGQAPLATMMRPVGQFFAGDWKGLAGSGAALAGMYTLTRLFGYNALTSIVHAAGKKSESNLEDVMVPVSALKSEAGKVVKLLSGESSPTDPNALPSGGARRLMRAYQEGDYAKNLGAMHETTGSLRGDVKAAVGSTRPGKFLFKHVWKDEEGQ